MKPKSSGWKTIVDFSAAILLGWMTWAGANALVQILHTGTIRNRRGPDIDLSENPLVFWALSGFFGAGTLLAGGLAVICLWISISNITRK